MQEPTQRFFRIVAIGSVVLTMAGCSSRLRPPPGAVPVVVRLETTGYCSCGTCCGWRRSWRFQPVHTSGSLKGKPKKVGQTASGVMARRGTLAADTSIYPFGTIMYIEGYGYGRVEDRGGAIKGSRLDLWFPTHREAKAWGRRKETLVKVWRLPPPD